MNPPRFSKTVSFLAAVFFTTLAVAQKFSLNFRHFTVNDGLPSSEVYRVLQDHKGFLWFATDKGVSRYDGLKFENFSIRDGLPDNTIIHMYMDAENRIWFVSISNRLAYYEKDKIITYRYNDTILKYVGNNNSFIQSFAIEKNGNVHINVHNRKYLMINAGGEVKKNEPIANRKDRYVFTINEIEPDVFFTVHTASPGFDVSGIDSITSTTYIQSRERKAPLVFTKKVMQSFENTKTGHVIRRKNGNFVIVRNDAFEISGESRSSRYPVKFPLYTFEDIEQDLWVGSLGEGVYLFRNRMKKGEYENYLPGTWVSCILEDHEGGYWFTTLNNCVYYLPNKEVFYLKKTSDEFEDKINCIESDGDSLVFWGTAKGKLFQLNTRNGEVTQPDSIKQQYGKKVNTIAGLFYDTSKSKLFVSTDGSLSMYSGTIQSPLTELRYAHPLTGRITSMVNASRIAKYGNDSIITNSPNGIFMFPFNRAGYQYKTPKMFRTTAVGVSKTTVMLAGSSSGLYRLKNNNYELYDSSFQQLRSRITDIKTKSNGDIVVSTRGSGLSVITADTVYQLNSSKGILSDNIENIYIRNENEIWLGSNRGLNRLTFDKNHGYSNPLVFSLSTIHGLPSGEINQVIRLNEIVWLATNDGVAYFNPDNIHRNTSPPPVYITGLKIMNKDTPVSYLSLPYDKSFITIRFVGLSFKDSRKINFRYKLDGLDLAWHYTQQNELQFPSLSPGDYTFKIWASNNDGVWSTHPAVLRFSVLPPFWERWWFRSIVIIALGISVYIFIQSRVRRIKQKSKLEKQMIELEANALRSQMNPHFIFNSLNSIQSFIISNKTDQAEIYLADFSRLIRLILDNSRSHHISLFREIETLNYYLKLEKMRFSGKFDFVVNCSPELDKEKIQIPPMLIQPYIENAILHGVAHLEKGGMIKIDFSLINVNHIRCVVDDNGIGRVEAGRKKSQQRVKHVSVGTKITEERLMLQQKLSDKQNRQEKFSVNVTDKKDEQGISTGTNVELNIPYKSLLSATDSL